MSDLIPFLNAGLCLDVAKYIRKIRRDNFKNKITELESKYMESLLGHDPVLLLNSIFREKLDRQNYIDGKLKTYEYRRLLFCETVCILTPDEDWILLHETRYVEWKNNFRKNRLDLF